MQTSTVVVLLCLIAAVAVRAQQEPAPEAAADQYLLDTPLHDRSPRNKRGLLLLKKKLLLGALGIKAAKIGAVGAGVAGALALKAKSKPKAVTHTSYYHHGSVSPEIETTQAQHFRQVQHFYKARVPHHARRKCPSRYHCRAHSRRAMKELLAHENLLDDEDRS